MASRVRLIAATAVAAVGAVVLWSTTGPAGGLVVPGGDEPIDDGFTVTERYTPADPEKAVVKAAPEAAGSRFTTLIIPRLKLRVPVVKGTDDAALARGVGQWANDTEPGGKGNYVLAGHRVTNGEPFADMPELRRGDRVVIETAEYRYVYEMDTAGDAYRVDDTELWPVDPLPRPMRGGPNRILTLITCAETFETDDRFVAFGHLYAIHLRRDR